MHTVYVEINSNLVRNPACRSALILGDLGYCYCPPESLIGKFYRLVGISYRFEIGEHTHSGGF